MFKDLPPDTVAFLWTFLGVGIMICLTALYCSRERPIKDRFEGFERIGDETYFFPYGSSTQEREEYMRLYPPKKTPEELFKNAAQTGSSTMRIRVDPIPEEMRKETILTGNASKEIVGDKIPDPPSEVMLTLSRIENKIDANNTELRNIIKSHSDRMAKKLDRNTLVGKVAEQLKEFE